MYLYSLFVVVLMPLFHIVFCPYCLSFLHFHFFQSIINSSLLIFCVYVCRCACQYVWMFMHLWKRKVDNLKSHSPSTFHLFVWATYYLLSPCLSPAPVVSLTMSLSWSIFLSPTSSLIYLCVYLHPCIYLFIRFYLLIYHILIYTGDRILYNFPLTALWAFLSKTISTI